MEEPTPQIDIGPEPTKFRKQRRSYSVGHVSCISPPQRDTPKMNSAMFSQVSALSPSPVSDKPERLSSTEEHRKKSRPRARRGSMPGLYTRACKNSPQPSKGRKIGSMKEMLKHSSSTPKASMGRRVESTQEMSTLSTSTSPNNPHPHTSRRTGSRDPRTSSGLPGASRRRKVVRETSDEPNKAKNLSALQELMARAKSTRTLEDNKTLSTKQTTELTVQQDEDSSEKNNKDSSDNRDKSIAGRSSADTHERSNAKEEASHKKDSVRAAANSISLDEFFKTGRTTTRRPSGKHDEVRTPDALEHRLHYPSEIPNVVMLRNKAADDMSTVSGITTPEFSDPDNIQRKMSSQRKKSSEVRMKAKRQHYQDMLKNNEIIE